MTFFLIEGSPLFTIRNESGTYIPKLQTGFRVVPGIRQEMGLWQIDHQKPKPGF